MNSDETYAKALRMMELAKSTMNPSRRRAIMDDAFALIREAKRLREKEPSKVKDRGAQKYRVWFHGRRGDLYFDLPITRRSDALWAAEALAAALSDDYDRYALWNGQTQLFNGPTFHAVFSCRTAFAVSQASQKIVLDTEELAIANHEILSRSQRLLDMTAQMRRIVTGPQDKPGTPANLP
jgi:hypothetical protein